MKDLLSLGARGILYKGKVWNERDEGVLSILEYNEMMERPLLFKLYRNKIRSECPSAGCTYAATVRLRHGHREGESRKC